MKSPLARNLRHSPYIESIAGMAFVGASGRETEVLPLTHSEHDKWTSILCCIGISFL